MGGYSGSFRKKISFSQVSNRILRDSTVSLKAKGLYGLIQSYVTLEDFTLYKDFLMSQCLEGESSFRTAWNELKNKGYLVQYKLRDPERNTFYYEYELLDEPHVENQRMGNSEPHVDYPHVGNPPIESSTCGNVGSYNNTNKNNTNKNNTNINTTINLSFDEWVDFVHGMINYDLIFVNTANQELVDDIVGIIIDTLSGDAKTYTVGGQKVFGEVVRSQMKKLTYMHIQFVLENYDKTSKTIKNPKNYIRSMLYSSVISLGVEYQNRVARE